MDYTVEFAKQGLGYLIAVILAGVIVWQQRRIDKKDEQINTLQETRVTDTNQYTTKYTEMAKEMIGTIKDGVVSQKMLQQSVDGLVNIVQGFLQKKI